MGLDSRVKPLPYLKALFSKIAFNVIDEVTLQEIGDILNVDHSSVSFYKKTLIPEISKMYKYVEIYLNYEFVDDFKSSNKMIGYNNLVIERDILLKENLNIKHKTTEDLKKFTQIELEYRGLPIEEQETYNEWAELKIRMMPSNQHRKEVTKYEQINCEM